jgi:hypothetical protein
MSERPLTPSRTGSVGNSRTERAPTTTPTQVASLSGILPRIPPQVDAKHVSTAQPRLSVGKVIAWVCLTIQTYLLRAEAERLFAPALSKPPRPATADSTVEWS